MLNHFEIEETTQTKNLVSTGNIKKESQKMRFFFVAKIFSHNLVVIATFFLICFYLCPQVNAWLSLFCFAFS